VHMGLVGIGSSATITVRCAPGQESWAGTSRNNVVTQSYNQFWGYAFTLSA
jgi:hypothetical protein